MSFCNLDICTIAFMKVKNLHEYNTVDDLYSNHGYFLLIITTLLFVVSTVWSMVNFHLEIAVALAAFRPDVYDILRHVAAPLLVIVRINVSSNHCKEARVAYFPFV